MSAPIHTDRLATVHAIARISLAIIFLWHGLVPKLIARHPDELRLLRDGGLSPEAAARMVTTVGIAEVVLGAAMLLAWRVRSLFLLVAGAMLVITPGLMIQSPQFTPAAFTPVTLNLATAALALIGWFASARD